MHTTTCGWADEKTGRLARSCSHDPPFLPVLAVPGPFVPESSLTEYYYLEEGPFPLIVDAFVVGHHHLRFLHRRSLCSTQATNASDARTEPGVCLFSPRQGGTKEEKWNLGIQKGKKGQTKGNFPSLEHQATTAQNRVTHPKVALCRVLLGPWSGRDAGNRAFFM